jgi:hypothetical protein
MARRSRGNSGVSFDQRTGFKVDGRKLRQDYYTGGWTTDADTQHPQDRPVIPGPDGRHWMPGLPSTDAIGATVHFAAYGPDSYFGPITPAILPRPMAASVGGFTVTIT